MKIITSSHRTRSLFSSHWPILLFVVIFGCLGSILLVASHAATPDTMTLYRLYKNPSQMVTSSAAEKNSLVAKGWALQGSFPYTNPASSAPVTAFRLYNASTQDHYWTTSGAERDTLVKGGSWVSEAANFTSASSNKVPYGYCRQDWYQLVNGSTHIHVYVSTAAERDRLAAGSWTYQKVGFHLDYACSSNPAPAPAPTPTPAPTPPKPTPAPVKTTPRTTSSAPVTTQGVTVSNAADGAPADIGTTAVTIAVPAGNAASFHLAFGTDPAHLDQKTAETATNNATVKTAISGLTGKTTYTYQIVRSLNNVDTASPTATFETSGYQVTLRLSSQNKPASGIKGTLLKQSAKSDARGELTFSNVAPGNYSVNFDYQGHTYSQAVNTADAAAITDPISVVVSQTINLDDLQTTAAVKSSSTPKHHSPVLTIIILVIGFILLALLIRFLLIRRRQNSSDVGNYPAMPPAPLPVAQPIVSSAPINPIEVPQKQPRHAKRQPEAEVLPEHAGESLREMVIASMRAEAAKRRDQQPPDQKQ